MDKRESVSSGIPALDERLGGLQAGRYYLLTGSPGSGKSSACLHFLAEGLRQGQRCAILTQENASDMFAQAEFIGHDFMSAAAEDRLIVLQYRIDFSNNYSRVGDPRAVADELIRACGGAPDRIVVDSILPFVQTGGTSSGAVLALVSLMENTQATALFTVPGNLGDSFYARLYDPLGTGTAGILHFEAAEDDVRKMTIRKIRQTPTSTEPLRFMIKAGVGIVELEDESQEPSRAPTLEPTRRLALVNSGGRLGGDVYSSFEREYTLDTFASPADLNGSIDNEWAAMVIVVDAMSADEILAFVRAVRRRSGVPIVLIAEGEGLRGSTRARAMRAGVDDFVTLEASPQELVARVEAARVRGPRPMSDRFRRESLLVQPRDDSGQILALPQSEIVRAARHHLKNTEHPVFALARLHVGQEALAIAWNALGKALRLRDGDLMARGEDSNELVLYLNDISRRHAKDLIDRVLGSHPRLESAVVELDHYPLDSDRIESWLAEPAAADPLRAAG